MGIVLFVLLLAVLLGAGGFAMNALWWVAGIVLVLWIVGFAAHGPQGRWYNW